MTPMEKSFMNDHLAAHMISEPSAEHKIIISYGKVNLVPER